MIISFFKKLLSDAKQEVPKDYEQFKKAKENLLTEIDSFGALVKDMQGPLPQKRKMPPQKKKARKQQ